MYYKVAGKLFSLSLIGYRKHKRTSSPDLLSKSCRLANPGWSLQQGKWDADCVFAAGTQQRAKGCADSCPYSRVHSGALRCPTCTPRRGGSVCFNHLQGWADLLTQSLDAQRSLPRERPFGVNGAAAAGGAGGRRYYATGREKRARGPGRGGWGQVDCHQVDPLLALP